MFIGIALLLYLLDLSLQSPAGFQRTQDLFGNPLVKVITWAVVAALLYHLIAGIKHLLLDMGIGETLQGGEMGARIVIALAALAIIIAGGWIW